ncbi:MAG: Fic family protein [Eggerthellaceae bacterium]|nr:Fic family protein [Eggerthellaceae bacterium]
MYLHERKNWTAFTWDEHAIAPLLGDARFAQGNLLGKLEGIGFDLSREIEVGSLCAEVIASSGIEGVDLDAAKVRSSVARRLGADQFAEDLDTRDVDGVVDMVLDAVENRDHPLSDERLFSWHAALFPAGYSGLRKINVAQYRTTPMEVVSGPFGHERIHFVAPEATSVPGLMADFLTWFNANPSTDLLVKAGLAHLRFLTVHPFEDGNGRIARALTDMLLAQSDGSPRRFYSMARYIEANRNDYYEAVEQAQKGTPDVTQWLTWFLTAVNASIEASGEEFDAVLRRSDFWSSIDSVPLNERQRKVLAVLVGSFEGKLTAKKWAKLCKVSPDTALRDINDLVDKGVLKRDPAGGRSTSYSLR